MTIIKSFISRLLWNYIIKVPNSYRNTLSYLISFEINEINLKFEFVETRIINNNPKYNNINEINNSLENIYNSIWIKRILIRKIFKL